MQTKRSQSHAFAAGTWDNPIVQWIKYLVFCLTYRICAFPAQDETLTWYAQYLLHKFRSHSSVVNYLSAVKTLHKLLNFDTSGFKGFLVKLTVQGLRRLNTHQPRQALAINPIILHHIYGMLNMDLPEDVTFWAVCLTSFFLLLHKSNSVVDSLNPTDCSKVLHRQDYTFFKDEVQVLLRWSKTNQFRQYLVFSLPKISGSILCPYSALSRMWSLVPGNAGLCFRRVSGLPFTYYQLHSKLCKSLRLAGYPDHLYSSHSMRRGGTTFCFLCGVPTELIKLLGGWKSDCYYRYLEFPMEA